jgi:hypothetical protein
MQRSGDQDLIGAFPSRPALQAAAFAHHQIEKGIAMNDFASATVVATASVDPSYAHLRTAGFATAGDGGGALYKRVATQPAHIGKIQSADGAWWEIAEPDVDVRMLGAKNDGSANATSIIQAALDVFGVITIAAGTYLINSLTIGSNKTIRTDGPRTILQQAAGQPPGTWPIVVAGSHVDLWPSGIKIIGNIATDTGEQYHAVLVRGATHISNIKLGDIHAKNIRGDGLLVGGLATARVDNLVFGDVLGENILRNAVSITGGENIAGGHVQANACGLFTVDLEPNPNSQPIRSVTLRSVKGAAVGLVGLDAQQTVEGVDIGVVDLDPSHTADSTPSYGRRATTVIYGIQGRNLRDARIRRFKARDISHAPFRYVYNLGELMGDAITFDHIDIVGCNGGETTYNALFQAQAVKRIIIGGGQAILLDATKKVLLGGLDSGIATTPDITLTTNGQVASACVRGRYRVEVNSAAGLNHIGDTKAVATAPGALASSFANGATVDGIVLATNDLVLIAGQTDARENGLYRVNATGAPTRLVTTGSGYFGGYVVIRQGTANAGKFFRCTNISVPVVGTTDITFAVLTSFDAYAFLRCASGRVEFSNIVLGRLAGFSTDMTFANLTATCGTFLFNTGADRHVAFDATLNGDYYALGSTARDHMKALRAGPVNLWTDGGIKLRVKNGIPTSDTDGIIVGTQS